MKLKTDKITTLLMGIYVFIMVVIVGNAMVLGASEQGYFILGCLSVIQILCALLIIKNTEGTIITISGIFVVFLYVFHTGQLFLNVFFKSYSYAKINFLEFVGEEEFFYSTVFSLAIITAIVVGIGLGNGLQAKKNVHCFLSKYIRKLVHLKKDRKKMMVVGWFLIITTLPFHAKAAYGQILLTSSGNYFDTFEYQISGIMYTYTQFMLVGITLVMLGYAEKKVKLTIIYLVTVVYFCWTMLSGGRGRAVIAIVFFTLLYLKLIKITLIKLIPFVIVGYVGLSALSIISIARNEGAITWDVLMRGFENSGSPLLRVLDEFGGTQYTMTLTMQEIPANFNYQYGSSYLLSLFSVIPNVAGIFTEINNDAIFYLKYSQNYMGGSIIAELYANFGYFFIIPAMLIGIFVSKLSRVFEKSLSGKQYMIIPFLTLLVTGVMWWVRDSAPSILRNPIWAAIYLEILLNIYDEIFRKKEKNEKDSNYNRCIANGRGRKNYS